MSPRALDHLVLPTASLAGARARLAALGFTVAPTGVHPFGTENCCVYFPGGSFMEPLALRDAALAAEHGKGGNVFVARDRAFRAHHGDEGFSALVLGSDDAQADYERLVSLGLSAGAPLTFSRPFTDASGATGTATFRLAFGAADGVPDGFFFACQRVGVPAVDRAALERHENGVTGIAEVALARPGGKALLEAVGRFTGQSGETIDLGGCTVRWRDPASFAAAYGVKRAADLPPLAAVTFHIADAERLSALFSARSIDYTRAGPRLIVAPASGQGAVFAFEESA